MAARQPGEAIEHDAALNALGRLTAQERGRDETSDRARRNLRPRDHVLGEGEHHHLTRTVRELERVSALLGGQLLHDL